MELKKQDLKVKGNFVFTIRDSKTNRIKRVFKKQNLVVTVGRANIAQRLAGITTNTLIINYGALGTSATAPANADIKLGTETFRKTTSSSTSSANQAFLSFFYSAPEVSGTFKEFGTFIDGTGTVNSGVLFSHISINITKSITETLTIDVTYTIT